MQLTPTVRISLGLVCLTVSVLMLGKSMGFAPDWARAVFESRRIFAENMAVQFSAAAERGDLNLIRSMLQTMIDRDQDVRSAAVRSSTGELLARAGNHLASWQPPPEGRSTPTHVQIPIFRGAERWATVEISFAPLWVAETFFSLKNSYLGLILFVSLAGFAGYFLFIKRTLRELDPSNVIPGRVQAAFNVLKEGVLILDEEEQIVLASTSFAETAGKTPQQLIGFKGSELGWKGYRTFHHRKLLPWLKVLQDGTSRIGMRLTMERTDAPPVKFIVNAAPVLDDQGGRRGVLVTFDNVTELEEKNQELNLTVSKLQIVTEEVQTKNRELEFLATHDPLTLLLNRRALNRGLEQMFNEARQQDRELSCIMCDIDHFKSVNDRYGHAAGDQVIKMVAAILQKNSRESDLAGRYGGEEFCIVLPGLTIRQAAGIAGRIRLAVREESAAGVSITMSFGVSSLCSKAHEPGELINQADKALYIAKESGRNRVVAWDDEEMADFAANYEKRKAKKADKQPGEQPESRQYRENNLAPDCLVVEVTESTMMEDSKNSMNILHQIKEMGVNIALDDFGTGYSSLEYLKNCPVSHVKIDRSFIADIEANERDATLVKSIVSMAHGMGLKVTAEGVENAEQAALLENYGCDEFQGFFFSKPVPVAEATALLRTGTTLPSAVVSEEPIAD